MTPIALHWLEQKMLPPRKREVRDQAGVLSLLEGMHCFNLSDVMPLLTDLTRQMNQVPEKAATLGFLPGERTLIDDGANKVR